MVAILVAVAKDNNTIQDKGKRKVAERIEGEQSYRVKVDSILMQATLAVEAKRKKRIQREERRKRENRACRKHN